MDPTERFSDRVETYVRYRPGYPDDVGRLLETECGLGPHARVADIGSGTGRLTELLLRTGAEVWAVEPNAEMRQASAAELMGRVHLVDGRAEATTLPDVSVDLVTAGQAFHWFDPMRARAEFTRILRPNGWVALIWNERRTAGSEFLTEYERILGEQLPEYRAVRQRYVPKAEVAAFFAPSTVRTESFENRQRFDFAGLLGRVLSSSYAPLPHQAGYGALHAALEELFDRTAEGGHVEFLYETQVFFGRLTAG